MATVFTTMFGRRWITKTSRLCAGFLSSPSRNIRSTTAMLYAPEKIVDNRKYAKITFQLPDKREVTVKALIGDTILDAVIDEQVDVDGFGVCEGTLACSTCHVVLPKEAFDRILKEQRKISEDEEDMLDLAKERTDTSRLGCQVKIAEWMNGLKIVIPDSSDIRLG